MAEGDHKNPEYQDRLKRRQEEIRMYRDVEANGANWGTYGFLFWHPIMGRVSAIVILGIALALLIAASKNAAPYIEYTDVTRRALFALFAIFTLMGLITSPPRAALGFELGFVSGGLIAYCLWIGVSIWQFIETGGFANNQVLTATIVICSPLMMLFGYFCKTFSREPLIPRSEQWFFFKSGNLTELEDNPSLISRLSGKLLWPLIVTILGLVFAALQTAWAVFDLPRLKL
ncbi:hypothetical protein [Rhodopila sp.]|uniref:hypothetical protein n=1 Tax=Rhodopila sp. TaxID=2480087 RepID=UPI003D0FF0F7